MTSIKIPLERHELIPLEPLSLPGSELSETCTWTPRRELALPNELLHKILLTVIADSVHSICVSQGDTTWERSMMDTLYHVSPVFKAISTELVIKAFDISKTARKDDQSLLRTMREIFMYLSRLGMRLRHPSDWDSVSFQTIDCSASSIVFAYALYLSCISLRRNASRSPRDVFESTHTVILTALTQSETLCNRVLPMEMTAHLVRGVQEELALARNGLTLVHSFADLDSYATSMTILLPHRDSDGDGPLSAIYAMIHTALLKVEAVQDSYTPALSTRRQTNSPIHELPGVLVALRKVHALPFENNEYDLRKRIDRIVGGWSGWCPFLNQDVGVVVSVAIGEEDSVMATGS
ncbi:hypothetical protein BDN70DRAFT_838990 [Pholiota conissans]|uniref:Uncharacterized protein n=1 Tax=Pholiota conissans TaxID=109636 RepID=A0A9P5YXS7_9AGAR|nr:hypothetical protein BDN70DRAFT_838990 [Pholiota conissans]